MTTLPKRIYFFINTVASKDVMIKTLIEMETEALELMLTIFLKKVLTCSP